jgi:hypothetical protein
VLCSTSAPFTLPAKLPLPDDPKFPASSRATFVAPQRSSPSTPPQPPIPAPERVVHHQRFDPADFYGKARCKLPFQRPAEPGLEGYILLRASAGSLVLADITRRQTVPARGQTVPVGLFDSNPVIDDSTGPRADLAQWVDGQLREWLACFNHRRKALLMPPPVEELTALTVLADSDGRRALTEHFYGGLLDDELRALADLSLPGDNVAGFRCVNAAPLPADPAPPAVPAPLVDVVDGKGDGRFLYKLQAVNQAGNPSSEAGNPRGVTRAAGPYYTRVTQPPTAPPLARVQPLRGGIVIVWAIEPGPDTAVYLVYRAASREDLSDLRYFGKPTATGLVDPTKRARLESRPNAWPVLGFSGEDVDPRIVALVPDPRLISRDSEGSFMAEITLPLGVVPSAVLGVYRAAEFDAAGDPLHQPGAFNYWRPPSAGGLAQLVTAPAGPVRVVGLRIGLGRAVPVVVVATLDGAARVLGVLPARRAAFLDAGTTGSPADTSALSGWTPPPAGAPSFYRVVAVDRFGNVSDPSAVGSAQPANTA